MFQIAIIRPTVVVGVGLSIVIACGEDIAAPRADLIRVELAVRDAITIVGTVAERWLDRGTKIMADAIDVVGAAKCCATCGEILFELYSGCGSGSAIVCRGGLQGNRC